jgi:small subunit ribosomal protein S17
MAEEEKDQQAPEAQDEQAPEEQPGEPAAEAPAAEAPAAEEPAAAEPAAAEPAAEAAPAPEAEPAEQLSPRERRRRERSRADGPAGPPRSLEDRLRERAEARTRKAQERKRWRAKQREKHRAAPQAEAAPAAAERTPAKRKTRQGVVVSSKADKTITVRIDRVARHRVYGKVMRETGTLHAHDEANEANEGDVVRVAEARPLSRTKRWRLVEVLEKAR